MALIYPSKEYTNFHGSLGEEIVYDELKSKLPDSYKIYHSEDWFRAMEQSNRDQPRGEIDFLICHQEKGILALEVKGGGIEYDPEKDQWWTVNENERERLKKSPAQQVQAGYYCLLERLKEHPEIEKEGSFTGILGWGLFFPQMGYDQGLNLPDLSLPRERILFSDDRETLQDSLEKIYQFSDEQMHFTGPMDDSTWEALNQSFLRRKFRIIPSLKTYVDRAEQVIYRLTEDQYKLLKVFDQQKEVFVRGCAGSGKTLLALEKARQLANDDQDVLWLCYNEDLADDIRDKFSDSEFTINHFHSFAMKYVQDAELEIPYPSSVYEDPGDEEWDEFWTEILPELLEEAIHKKEEKYDAIILDEAQDFSDSWYLALTDLLREGENWFYVFYDPHQSIYGDLPDWLQDYDSSSFTLPENVRNSEKVGRGALELGEIDESIEFGHEGKNINFSLAENEEDLIDQLRKAIHSIFVEDDLDPSKSIILERHKKENSPLGEITSLGNFDITDSPSDDQNSLQFSTIHSYKGLEADVVFLLIPEWNQDHKQLYYTGATRAKHLLWIFSKDKEVKEILPDDCVNLVND